MTKNTISVLFPNYNNGPFLKVALDSIFQQTHQDFIIYFVDDHSTDDSVEIAKSYNDPRLQIIQKEKNSGIVATMNIALDKIETEFFIRMDGDDISKPDRFETLLKHMNDHPEIGVCTSDMRMFGMDDKLVEFEADPLMNKANLIFGQSIGHASSIFRTAVFKQNNIRYADRFWRMEDYYLFYRLKDLTLTTRIQGEYYMYRRGEYNDNPEISARKNNVFLTFYEMVLLDLGLTATAEDLELHLQLTRRTQPSYSFHKYTAHLERIITANRDLKLYPAAELNLVLQRKLNEIVFLLIDTGKMNWSEIWTKRKEFKGLLSYAIKTKIFNR
jgi:glycosyltransferase involved in cell wall biosynthesis